ncbi:energy-coupling factor transporter transmembrane component T family protein [Lawsonibacter celer]|jgi:energy-coupling factor transport system permease protein|uniref:energy-coupling factor transporter transmembrane component T family protein n=1 Tax=Lawsonibacter celer TaxID=2986526 RepID=UPI001645947B|nr:energy-coupling factor transporter transmembrane component T [Lawsonibacter celer]
MALKDITLGQYFPGSTVLHRLDPRTKLVGTVAYIVALFLAKQLVSYGILLVLLAVLIAVSKVGLKAIVRGMKPVLVIVIITAVLNLFYTSGGGTPLVQFWIFKIYPEGIWAAVFMVLRIFMLITCTFLLTYTTSPIMLTDGLERLLGPLKRIGLPVHELSMMMSIALRFIPTLIEETDKIMSAQKARGADFDTGNLMQKAKALLPLLVPLFISAFRRADELATAMECRCYHGGEGRTRLRQLKLRGMDIAFLAGCLTLCVGIGVLRYLGL